MKKIAVLLICFAFVFVWSAESHAGTLAVMKKLCTRCHKLYRPFSQKKDKAGWEAIVTMMAGKKEDIKEHKAEIVDFLSRVRNINSPVQTAKDPAKMTDMEKKHVPLVNAPLAVPARSAAKISVQVGEELHPVTKEHHIYAVDLYVNNRWSDIIELEPTQKPIVEFEARIFKTFPIEIVAHCNKDGDWSTKTEIKTE